MATHQTTPFQLHKKDPIRVKPSKPTPSQTLSLSTIDNEYFLDNLTHTLYVYKPRTDSNGNCCNGNGHHNMIPELQINPNPASVIKQGLSKTLVYYYPLGGKIRRHKDGNLRITCNAEEDGVPFLEAAADCHLSSLNYLDKVDSEIAKEFIFHQPIKREEGYDPLRLQVTMFACGGFVLGMSLSHSICDGFGAVQFFKALAELAGGKIEPSVIPIWERERLVGKPDPGPIQPLPDLPQLAASPYLPTTELVNECVNVSSEGIRKLKLYLMKEIGDENGGVLNGKVSFTNFEVLAAYVWRSRFRALRLNPDDMTMFCMTIGIRNLFNPQLPSGYYGNAFIISQALLVLGRELTEGPLSSIAKLIKEGKTISSETEFICNSLSSMERNRLANNMKIYESRGGIMSVTDWRRLSLLEEEDFGWGGCVNVAPLPYDIVGHSDVCVFLPPFSLEPSMKGGVRVFICLPKVAMAKFKEEIDALQELAN